MTVSRYLIKPHSGNWADAHFELRIDDANRPFHIVLRQEGATLGLNSMVSGTWQEELSPDIPISADTVDRLTVEIVDNQVRILIGGEILSFAMSVSQSDVTLAAAAKNMHWVMETGETLPPMLHLSASDKEQPVAQVSVGHRRFRLPKGAAQTDHARLLDARMAMSESYLHFLSTRLLLRPGAALTVIDIDPNPIYAMWIAALFPMASVYRLSQGKSDDAFLTALAKENGLKGIEIVSTRALRRHLARFKGDLLVQGANAFKELGAEIAALTPQQRDRLSVWTTADTIVPGNTVLPCSNAQVLVAPNWALNWSAAFDLSGRRPGLDVVVAAYNAKSYLNGCVESLLCKGREDVRIIIVDDGSTDGSGEAAAARFAADPRVRVERKPNGGCASARNYGRLVSDATHIAFVDADDFVTPDFFADLYDLALYSGCEITQGGFDFFDEGRSDPYYDSYEDADYADYPQTDFRGQPVIQLNAQAIIKGQPTIWRKVYRRDFLDAKNIYFPENVRAYDDYIFQLLSLTAARDILMMPRHKYHYRQHPAQDIRQGDERHFYMLYMFRELLKRSVDEGWANFGPYAESVIDSINWSANGLRPELIDSFLQASARFCVAIAKTYGTDLIEDLLHRIEHPDFAHHYRIEMQKTAHVPDGPFWSYFSGPMYHPDVLHMRQAMNRAL